MDDQRGKTLKKDGIMKERRTAATDGATLLTDDGITPLMVNAVIRLTMLDGALMDGRTSSL